MFTFCPQVGAHPAVRDPDQGKHSHEDGVIYPLEGCPHLPHASLWTGTVNEWMDGLMCVCMQAWRITDVTVLCNADTNKR